MSLSGHTLSKDERLHGRKDISRLIAEGKFGGVQGLRCCVRPDNGLAYSRIMVSVPKKLFKRAVKRNLLKRRMREAYRLQKELLECGGVDFLLSWSSKEVGDWETVRAEVATALTRIDKAVAKQRAASDGNATQPGRLTEAGADGASRPSTERVPACRVPSI